MANDDELMPSCKPMHAARDVTVAECDDGMPPELSILLVSHFFSLYLHIQSNKLNFKKKINNKYSYYTKTTIKIKTTEVL
ncbi:hypothetical protein Hanom_Chr08g00740311 [Helianthus anomalus]